MLANRQFTAAFAETATTQRDPWCSAHALGRLLDEPPRHTWVRRFVAAKVDWPRNS